MSQTLTTRFVALPSRDRVLLLAVAAVALAALALGASTLVLAGSVIQNTSLMCSASWRNRSSLWDSATSFR